MEERARHMKAVGITEPEDVPALDTQETTVFVQ
jgi:hypothetical protein